MTCTSCGDKPKGSSKGFPRAVVEINNPESLVLLRKVVIPASMGTEEDVPPAIGKYFNVLLQYESNGHIYLYSSDGIPTAIEANIPQEVLDRIDQLEIDVDLLETGLANETTAREAADSALSSSINSLSSSLSAETAAREQADTTLQNNITAEATARANADTNLQNQIAQEAQARAAADTAINGAITAEASTRQTADAGLQSQIDAITASSDVKDIVGTKAELNNYDTSTLGNNDIIKVLQDESENDATTYYRWNTTTQQFTLIGEEGPYYTKSQADTLLNAKQNTLTAGSNVQIVNDTISATDTTYTAGTGLALNGTQFSVDTTAIATQSDLTAGLATKQDTLTAGTNIQINNNVISATDTTYTHFTGATASTDGVQGLVPAPIAGDENKFLKADGTWDTAGGGGGPTVVQTTGTSQADVMSQNAATSMVFADPATATRVSIGNANAGASAVSIGQSAYGAGNYSVALGHQANTYSGDGAVALGQSARARSSNAIAIGYNANQGLDGGANSVAIGASAIASTSGSVSVGYNTRVQGTDNVALGSSAQTTGSVLNATALGTNTLASHRGSVALGSSAQTTVKGQIMVGTTNIYDGYNSTNYRIISGVHDAQSDNDAVNLGQLNGRVLQNAGAPTTSTVGTVGQLLEDTTNGKLYICTDTTGGSYTWVEVGAGGSGGGVIELTTADYNWPTNNPDGVAIWKLDTGIYTHAGGVKVYYTSSTDYSQSCLFAVHNNGYQTSCLRVRGADSYMQYFDVNNANGGVRAHFYISQPVDNLASSSEYAPLSAKQGKILKDFIGDLTNLTTTDKTNLVAAIDELDSALAGKQDTLTAGSNITIAEESGALVISSTGSGADVFTTNEWNALWA